MGAMLGSTVDTYSTLVLGWLLEEFHDFLREWVDSVPEVDSRLISPCRHARRQLWQWHIVPGFADLFAYHTAFPMNAGRCSVWSLTRPLRTTTWYGPDSTVQDKVVVLPVVFRAGAVSRQGR